MLNLEVKTKLSIDETIARLKSFFGEGGLNLEITEETLELVCFEGGGGFVRATICSEEGKTVIDLQTREWEVQVREFSSRVS
jgi:hypothetical protein